MLLRAKGNSFLSRLEEERDKISGEIGRQQKKLDEMWGQWPSGIYAQVWICTGRVFMFTSFFWFGECEDYLFIYYCDYICLLACYGRHVLFYEFDKGPID